MNISAAPAIEKNVPDSSGQPEHVIVSLDVVWQNSSRKKEDARMSEISMNGCYIDSLTAGRSLGDKIQFKVRLPSGPWVALQGEVILDDYPMGFELRYTGLTAGDKRFISQVVVAHGGDPGNWQSLPTIIEINTATHATEVPRRVLVADDDSLTLRMVSAIVETEGYQVVPAFDGQEALKILQQDATFSAAILDTKMPHVQGLDLIRIMKSDERLQGIPVGMITAEQEPKIWDESVAAGACAFLPKPFTPPQMQMMLRMLTSKALNHGNSSTQAVAHPDFRKSVALSLVR